MARQDYHFCPLRKKVLTHCVTQAFHQFTKQRVFLVDIVCIVNPWLTQSQEFLTMVGKVQLRFLTLCVANAPCSVTNVNFNSLHSMQLLKRLPSICVESYFRNSPLYETHKMCLVLALLVKSFPNLIVDRHCTISRIIKRLGVCFLG